MLKEIFDNEVLSDCFHGCIERCLQMTLRHIIRDIDIKNGDVQLISMKFIKVDSFEDIQENAIIMGINVLSSKAKYIFCVLNRMEAARVLKGKYEKKGVYYYTIVKVKSFDEVERLDTIFTANKDHYPY